MKRQLRELRPTNMRLPVDLRAAMKQQALREGLTVTSLTIILLREGLIQRRKKMGGGNDNV